MRYGTYQNINILELLFKHKFNFKIKDNQGKTPADYAAEYENGVLLRKLAELTGDKQILNSRTR